VTTPHAVLDVIRNAAKAVAAKHVSKARTIHDLRGTSDCRQWEAEGQLLSLGAPNFSNRKGARS
jgi:hypothetical protein